jgi:hypothetical protein
LKSKKTLTIIITIIAAVIGSWIGQELLFQKPNFDEQLMAIASELNKSCPIMVDSETRLDNSIGGPDKSFTYNYTLINYSKEEIDIDYFLSTLRPSILNNVKTNPDLATFRDKKIEMKYSYKDKNGVFITKIIIKPEEYLN